MKKMTLNNIYEWPLMTQVLLLGLIFAVVFYLGYRFDISRQMLNLSRAQSAETDLKQQIELVIHKNKSIELEVSHLKTLQTELEKWNKQLVPYSELPQVLNEILKIAGDNHLYISSFSPEQSMAVEKVSYLKVPIKTIVVGTFVQIADFISQIANLNRIVTINDFSISSKNEPMLLGEKLAKQAELQHLLSAEINLAIYHLPEER